MALLVLAYPTVSEADHDWMQEIRSKHDELYYRVVAPHFTLVFPVFDMDRAAFTTHVAERVRDRRPFRFVLRCAVVVKDSFNAYSHVFLVPDEGHADVVKLHDALYTGPLAPHLRLDIPFIPHVGVGNAIDPLACKRLADTLNGQDFRVGGMIEKVDVVWYEDDKVTPVATLPLGG
jgi:hypothetical protein